jgi:hypothetical protein
LFNSSSNLINFNEFKAILRSIQTKICHTNDSSFLNLTESSAQSSSQFFNIYHLFLRYLYLNLRENTSSNLNSTTNNNGSNLTALNLTSNSTSSTNLVWRQFKGRLYTRLHDKRIAELDLNGIINVAHLFFVLIKSFSTSSSLTAIAMKSEQLESYFRVLNIFVKARNLKTIEHILLIFNNNSNSTNSNLSSNTISNRMNAIIGIFNTKFVAIKLWFDSSDISSDANVNISEEIQILLQHEFIDIVNSWLDDSGSLVNLNANLSELKENHQPQMQQPNQIANFKNSQALGKFLSDFLVNYADNCKNILPQSDDARQIGMAGSSHLYQLAFVSCHLLSKSSLICFST